MSEAATQSDIARWLTEGTSKGATHVIVVCDTFDHGDFPVYVMPGQNPREVMEKESKKEMQRVMEVYSLTGKHTIADQVREYRAFHYD